MSELPCRVFRFESSSRRAKWGRDKELLKESHVSAFLDSREPAVGLQSSVGVLNRQTVSTSIFVSSVSLEPVIDFGLEKGGDSSLYGRLNSLVDSI